MDARACANMYPTTAQISLLVGAMAYSVRQPDTTRDQGSRLFLLAAPHTGRPADAAGILARKSEGRWARLPDRGPSDSARTPASSALIAEHVSAVEAALTNALFWIP